MKLPLPLAIPTTRMQASADSLSATSESSQTQKPTSYEDVVQAIRAFVAEAFEPGQLPAPVSQALVTRSVTLLQMIKALGEYLTAEDEKTRSRGVELLAQIVIDFAPSSTVPEQKQTLERSLLDPQAVRTLTAFLTEKLEDGSNVAASIAKSTNSADKVVPGSAPSFRFKAIPEGTEMLSCTIRALTLLSQLGGFGSEQTKGVISSLFAHVKPREHPQAVRFQIYNLVDSILSRHRHALKTMGKEFLKGYVDFAEGEKDPRNLMYLFAMDRVILIEWELDAEMAEAFFDITYCYFPITFRPPPDDPYGIQTEDLKGALRNCLTANPSLAPHAMPLLLEKLAASGGATKMDTLETLEAAMPVFGKAAVMANEKKLWEGFKVEIMAATDDETSRYAQRALSSFFRTLYQDVENPEGIAVRAVADALRELEEPEKSLAKPACDLLCAMVKSCSSMARLATYAVLEQLLGMFKDPEVVSVRGPILAHIASVLQALRETYGQPPTAEGSENAALSTTTSFKFAAPSSRTDAQPQINLGESSDENDAEMASARSYDGDRRPLDAMRDELLSALSNGVRSTQYRASALLAFVHLTHIPTFLTAPETNYIAESVNDLILSPGADDVRSAAIDGLRDIAKVNPRVLEETTLPTLFSRLPDRMPDESNASASYELKGTVRRVLGALARLCAQPNLFDMLVVRLTSKLDLVCASSFSSVQERSSNVGYARGILITLLTLLEEKVAKSHTDIPRYGSTVSPRLLALVLSAALRSEDGRAQPPVACDPSIIRDISRLLTLLTRSLKTERQQELITWLEAAFLRGDIGASLGHSRLGQDSDGLLFEPFSPRAPAVQRNTVYAFASAFVACQAEVRLSPTQSVPQRLSQLLDFIVTSTNDLQADAGYALLSSTVNKHVSDPSQADLNTLWSHFWDQEVVNGQKGSLRQSRAIWAWFWAAKALLVRNSSSGQSMIEQALQKFFSPDIAESPAAKEAGRALGLISQADDGVLARTNGAVIRLLYRQKFYSYILPKITSGHAQDQSQSGIYLIALAAVLPSMPHQMIQDRLVDIFPLLIQALDLPDASARSSAATTITLAAAVGQKRRNEEVREGTRSKDGSLKPAPLDLVQDHAHTLVERLLSIAKPGQHSTPPVRIAALRCLATIVRCLPSGALKSEQVIVLRALNGPGMGVDDPKREVRIEAVDCKAAWHVVI